MKVVGLLSGTSMDGIDAAAVEIDRVDDALACKLEAFETTPYSNELRADVERVLRDEASVQALSSLAVALGQAFALAAKHMCDRSEGVQLIGSHGQTVFHEPNPADDAGRLPSTLQLGEPSAIVELTGITTVADFRVADLAAGGQGAPLVSYVDHLLLCSQSESRVALNIGGIANVTLLPAGCPVDAVRAYDTGPGNMPIDIAVRALLPDGPGYDRDGAIALSGRVDASLLAKLLAHPYFGAPAPKTAGREQFGETFFRDVMAQADGLEPRDVVATLTALTARTIANEVPRECALVVAAGGGVRNLALMAALRQELRGREVRARLALSNEFGLEPDAKEAIAFAVLAYEAIHGRTNTLAHATGARHPVVAGKIVPGSNFSALMRSIFG
ncbi:MAG TPA: anhydro-N-acetylmuramic acid kinase [Candidatus Acidoferrales bacterium]|nr:anhydro-N-acetylmuramic acid kinase [Candidatus Acidoferrales bacterium]